MLYAERRETTFIAARPAFAPSETPVATVRMPGLTLNTPCADGGCSVSTAVPGVCGLVLPAAP